MLRSLLILLTVGLCLGKINYRITDKIVSEEEKDNIIAQDDDAAFDSFINTYDDLLPDDMRGALSPEDLKAERAKQKKVFVRNIADIREHNKKYARGEVSYKMVVNSFAVMDEDNRRIFLGLGKDTIDPKPTLRRGMGSSRVSAGEFDGGLFNTSSGSPPIRGRGMGSARAATTLDWRSKLGPVKDQGTCGSCWTFPATALLEFAIQKAKGIKVPLSEQQLLDCTYESQNYNACKGGWYYQAWDYIIKNNNKLASQADYNYQNRDGACYDSYYGNALAGRVKLKSYYKVPASQIIDKMQIMPLAVAFYVENSFYSIGSGVFDGCYTYRASNHAVTMTGYGSTYWEIRNSWGGDWGNRGYARFRRSGTRSICNLLSAAYAITTDRSDEKEEDRDDDKGGDCRDNSEHAANCGGWANAGYCETGEYVDWMKQNCKKSCNQCREVDPEPDEECVNKRDDSECQNWEDNYSYCTQGDYVEWMEINCAKTCRACEDEEEETDPEPDPEPDNDCEDKDEYSDSCGGWSDAGYCGKKSEYHEWMIENCAKTCKACKDDKVDPTERSEGDCEDDNKKCSKWADKGYCTDPSYKDYMVGNCKKSCDTCEEATPSPTPSEEPTDPPVPELIPHAKVSQSSTLKVKRKNMGADLAVDGDDNTRSQTKCTKSNAWFRYKFKEAGRVTTVEILNGNFDRKRAKLNGAIVYVQDDDGLKKKCGQIEVKDSSSKSAQTYSVDCDETFGSSIEILQKTKLRGKKCLDLKEVRVYGFTGDDSTASPSPSEPSEEPTEEEEEEEKKDDNDGCPGGTVRCPDGICKHAHMCYRG